MDTRKLLDDLYAIHGIKWIKFQGDSIIHNFLLFAKMLFLESHFKCESDVDNKYWPQLCDETPSADIQNNEQVDIYNFNMVHEIWHGTMHDIESNLKKSIAALESSYTRRYGKEQSKWPMRIVVELSLIISEREYHCTAPRSILANNMFHKVFGNKDGWYIFPYEKMTEATQSEFSWATDNIRDGMHPAEFVLVDHIRMLFEFIFNTL